MMTEWVSDPPVPVPWGGKTGELICIERAETDLAERLTAWLLKSLARLPDEMTVGACQDKVAVHKFPPACRLG